VKDLDIVYATSKIMESDEINDALVKIVNLIPSGFQFSKLVSVRIIYNGVKFQTDNFKKSKWVQVVTISTDHKNVGKIEVFYLKEKSFTKAEELMLREVASEIGNIAERKKFNEEILKYKFIADQAPQMIAIADLQGKIVYANGSWVKHHGYST